MTLLTGGVRLDLAGARARITIDRSHARNSLSSETLRGLGGALASLENRPEIRVLVLESAGDGAFSGGGDLTEFSGRAPEDGLPDAYLYACLLKTLRRIPAVVVARVQGPAVGGGFGLVLAADLAVASTRARFATPEAALGLFPMMVLAGLVRELPPKIVGRLVFGGGPLSAQEAFTWGIVNEVVPPEELDSAVERLVAKVLESSPAAIAHGKRALVAARELPYDEAVDEMANSLDRLWRVGEALEGVRAYLEKRLPAWNVRA